MEEIKFDYGRLEESRFLKLFDVPFKYLIILFFTCAFLIKSKYHQDSLMETFNAPDWLKTTVYTVFGTCCALLFIAVIYSALYEKFKLSGKLIFYENEILLRPVNDSALTLLKGEVNSIKVEEHLIPDEKIKSRNLFNVTIATTNEVHTLLIKTGVKGNVKFLEKWPNEVKYESV